MFGAIWEAQIGDVSKSTNETTSNEISKND
jgi:hypothetical protein